MVPSFSEVRSAFFFRKCLLDCSKLKMKALLRFRIPGATDAWRHNYTALRVSYVVSYLKRYSHLSAYGATTPSGPWPPLKDPSTLLCLQLVSCFLVFLGSAIHPSGRHPSILFLVFLLILCSEDTTCLFWNPKFRYQVDENLPCSSA